MRRFVWLLLVASAFGANPPKLSKDSRMAIERYFTAEMIYAHTIFPAGFKGLSIKDGSVQPGTDEVQWMVQNNGAACKPGDMILLSKVIVQKDRIRFEINGGPLRKPGWRQRVQVGTNGGWTPLGQDANTINANGSYVDLFFNKYVPDLTADQVKELLRPVFDFTAKSQLDAYLDSVPVKAREAIRAHKVLVGMPPEMVFYSKGKPPQRVAEKDETGEYYEEWIYGTPPFTMFVRFKHGEVVRVETVNGTQIEVRTDREIDVPNLRREEEEEAKKQRPPQAPSLKRPGEQ